MKLSVNKFCQINSKYNIEKPQRTFVTKPQFKPEGDIFVRTANINFKGNYTQQEKEKFNDVVTSLKLFSVNAEKSFDEQVKSEGIFGKTIEALSTIWGSKNREKLVDKDIEAHKKQVKELEDSIEQGKFKEKFKEIFQVDYNQENIDNFNKANKRLMLASTTTYMADTIREKLSKDLEMSKNLNGKLKDYQRQEVITYSPTGSCPLITITTPKEEIFNSMEKSLTEVVGGKEVLKNMLAAQNVKEDAKMEEKYKAYSNISNYLVKTSQMTAKRCSDNKTPKELKEDYDKAYKAAYGDKNNIQKRVDKYNRSQKIGAALLKSSVKNPLKLALIGLVGLTASPLAGVGIGVLTSFGIDKIEEATSSKNDKKDESLKDATDKTLKELMTETAMSYADYAISEGMNILIPELKTGNILLNTILSTTRKTTLDVTKGMISDYMSTGKWDSDQIAPRAFVTIVFGKISVDDPLGKELLSLTKSGLDKNIKYDDEKNNTVKQFIERMQIELQKEYMKNPELYSSMKMLSMCNPEEFEKMISKLLKEHIEETAKNNQENSAKVQQ